jgi:hypothetical protein
VFVDEAEFIKHQTWFTGPFAFLMQNAVILAVSTPGYQNNQIQTTSKVLDDNGNLICVTVDYSFECEDCREAQKKDPRIKCECRAHLRPPHIIQSSVDRAILAMGEENKDAIDREIFGVFTSGDCKLLQTEKVERLFTAERYAYSRSISSPDCVFVTCDPNGASRPTSESNNNSKFSFVTTFLSNEGKIVVSHIYIYIYSLVAFI